MAKQLKFTFKDKEYVLEFTRRTVTEMEKKGFVAAEVENKPMSTLPALFEGAFLAHHRFEKKEVINEIFSHMTNKEELIGKLQNVQRADYGTGRRTRGIRGKRKLDSELVSDSLLTDESANKGASVRIALLPLLIRRFFSQSSPITYQ